MHPLFDSARSFPMPSTVSLTYYSKTHHMLCARAPCWAYMYHPYLAMHVHSCAVVATIQPSNYAVLVLLHADLPCLQAARNGTFLAGDRLTYIDLSVFGTLSLFQSGWMAGEELAQHWQ